jgi:hypothetical protein
MAFEDSKFNPCNVKGHPAPVVRPPHPDGPPDIAPPTTTGIRPSGSFPGRTHRPRPSALQNATPRPSESPGPERAGG